MKACTEHLGEAADNVKRRPDFVIHILYKGRPAAIGFELELISTGKIVVLLLQIVVATTDGCDTRRERLLHADEAVGESPYAIATGAWRQRFVKKAISYSLCPFIELAQGLDSMTHSLITEEHE